MRKRLSFLVALFLGVVMTFSLVACGDNPEGPPQGVKQPYTVTYYYNYDGAPTNGVYKTEKVAEGEKATAPTEPTRESYEFKGWYTTAQTTGTAYAFTATLTGDLALYAKWEEEEPPAPSGIEVTYYYNYDGAPNQGVYKTEKTLLNDAATAPAEPTREGYEFKGWYTDEECETAYDFDTAVTHPVNLYAKWEEEQVTPPPATKYDITYYYNYTGAPSDGVYKTEKIEENAKVAAPTEPTREGHEFRGWYTDEECETAYDFDTAVTAAVNLYAKWTEYEVPPELLKYDVTYYYNYTGAPSGGVYDTVEVVENAKATPPTAPTREGYDFLAWYTDAECETAYDFDTAVTAAVNLYAKWEIKEYTVTLYYNYTDAPDGGKYFTAHVLHNGTVEMPHAPARTGYEFKGWADAATGGNAANTSAAITADTAYYATWAAFDSSTVQKVTTSETLVVNKVANLSDDFIMGMDASSVYSLERAGVKFYDYDGAETDVFKVLAESGINTVRIRVWNDPFDEDGNGYGGGNNDINAALEMGKRITTYGMGVMIDFHYSDFWADPGKQQVPKAWAGYTVDKKAAAIETYTKESLQLLKTNGVNVTIVQVGNETTNSICGESNWANRAKLFNAGSKAVREVYPDALVAIHFTNPERAGNYASFASQLNSNNVDYDVFASSWYPFWHGTLDNLNTVLSNVAKTYNKKVMVAETSYAYTLDDMDFHDNTVRKGTNDGNYGYDFTVQGQADLVRDTINTIANTTNGIGVCYWEGTWISVVNTGATTKAECQALWEQYGCGWASSYAAEYDAEDAGKWYGGSAVDNQAMFATDGSPLESLKVYSLVYTGCNEPVINDLYISGAMNEWTPAKVATVDYKTHTVSFKYEFTDSMLGSSKGFGLTVCRQGAPDQSTDNQLCWIGGATNCKIGENTITVDFTNVCAGVVTTGDNLYVTEAGVYAFTITFDEDDSTPLSVSAVKLTYDLYISGYMNTWAPTEADKVGTLDLITHTVEFEYTLTKGGTFGFTILDPATGAGLNWVGGTGNMLVNGTAVSGVTINDPDSLLEYTAGGKKRDFAAKVAGTYKFKIVFEDDNITPKSFTVEAGDDVEVPDPSNDTYAVYTNGLGGKWTVLAIEGADIDNETHSVTFDITLGTESGFGFVVCKNGDTSKTLNWIGQNGNIYNGGSSALTGVTVTNNAGESAFVTVGTGNLSVKTAGTYRITLVFAEDNYTLVSMTIDTVPAA